MADDPMFAPDPQIKRFWAVALVVVLVGALVCSRDDSPSRPASSDAEDVARIMCQWDVKRRLRSPTTADFGSHDETHVRPVTGRPGHWVLDGKVTAVNAFNAPITNAWVCDANTNDSTATARILE